MDARLIMPVMQAVLWAWVLVVCMRDLRRERSKERQLCGRWKKRDVRRYWAQWCPVEAGREHTDRITGPGHRVAVRQDGSVQVWAQFPAAAAEVMVQAEAFHASNLLGRQLW